MRGQGDTSAQNLLSETSGPQLAAAQTAQEAQAASLLQPGLASATNTGPSATDPSGGTNPVSSDASANDPVMQAALARRTAQAATNIRTYGSEIGKVSAYSAPTQAVNLAIQANKTGIMPAEEADALLRSGSSTMLLPSQTAYSNAGTLGSATRTAIQSAGQNALDTANLTASQRHRYRQPGPERRRDHRCQPGSTGQGERVVQRERRQGGLRSGQPRSLCQHLLQRRRRRD